MAPNVKLKIPVFLQGLAFNRMGSKRKAPTILYSLLKMSIKKARQMHIANNEPIAHRLVRTDLAFFFVLCVQVERHAPLSVVESWIRLDRPAESHQPSCRIMQFKQSISC